MYQDSDVSRIFQNSLNTSNENKYLRSQMAAICNGEVDIDGLHVKIRQLKQEKEQLQKQLEELEGQE